MFLNELHRYGGNTINQIKALKEGYWMLILAMIKTVIQ